MNFSWVIPGKLAGSQGPVHEVELLYLKGKGVRAIVRMEHRTISGEGSGLIDMAEFVTDTYPPSDQQIDRIVAFIEQNIENDRPVAVSCMAGLGRTGTVLACYLVYLGYSAGDALEKVRMLRPGSVESPHQQDFVHGYEKRLRKSSSQD